MPDPSKYPRLHVVNSARSGHDQHKGLPGAWVVRDVIQGATIELQKSILLQKGTVIEQSLGAENSSMQLYSSKFLSSARY